MNVFLLLEALRNQLKPELATLPLPGRQRPERGWPGEATPLEGPARVFLGSMPPKLSDALEVVPFVLIQPLRGHDREGLHHLEVVLRLAVRDEDPEAAENDLHNLIALVRRCIMGAGRVPLAGKYRLEDNGQGEIAPWVRPDEQAPPYAEAYILTHWNMKGLE